MFRHALTVVVLAAATLTAYAPHADAAPAVPTPVSPTVIAGQPALTGSWDSPDVTTDEYTVTAPPVTAPVTAAPVVTASPVTAAPSPATVPAHPPIVPVTVPAPVTATTTAGDTPPDWTYLPCSVWADTSNPVIPPYTNLDACVMPNGALSVPGGGVIGSVGLNPDPATIAAKAACVIAGELTAEDGSCVPVDYYSEG